MFFPLVFDDVIIKQLKQAAKNQHIKEILTTMLNKIELEGPLAGKLLDSHLFLYEMKSKRPPIRLYFKHKIQTNEMYILEFEMKTSLKKQNRLINKLIQKLRLLKS